MTFISNGVIQAVDYNSLSFSNVAPSFPPYGTLIALWCSGTTEMGTWANGAGGTFNNVVQTNSPTCGWIAPPLAPNLSITPGNTYNTLSWNSVATAISYTIYWSKTPNVAIGTNTTPVGSLLTFTFPGLTNGTAYHYIVAATNAGGQGPASNEVTGTPGAAPLSPPVLTSVTPGITQNTIAWSAVGGATGYNLYRGTSPGVYSLLGGFTSPHVDSGLTAGITYYYVVTDVSIGGESGYSNVLSGTPTPGAPTAPATITVTPGVYQNTISWSSVSGATSYNLYRSTSTGTETLFLTGATSPYINSGLSVLNTYYYKASAVNSGGESALSTEANGTPLSPPFGFNQNDSSVGGFDYGQWTA